MVEHTHYGVDYFGKIIHDSKFSALLPLHFVFKLRHFSLGDNFFHSRGQCMLDHTFTLMSKSEMRRRSVGASRPVVGLLNEVLYGEIRQEV